MARYEGLPAALREEVLHRDGLRCRWTGRTNAPLDLHHIEYRRGFEYDRAQNLISLSRNAHSFVHGQRTPTGLVIVKEVAQLILAELVIAPGSTGLALWRQQKVTWARMGLCEHGGDVDTCLHCVRRRSGPGAGLLYQRGQ